jgi:hypothetical protein
VLQGKQNFDFKNGTSVFYEKNFDIDQASICKAKFTKEGKLIGVNFRKPKYSSYRRDNSG